MPEPSSGYGLGTREAPKIARFLKNMLKIKRASIWYPVIWLAIGQFLFVEEKVKSLIQNFFFIYAKNDT